MGKPGTTKRHTGKSPAGAPTAKKSSYRARYQRFAPLAAELPDSEVQICRADVRIAFANVRQGVRNACADPARVRAALPQLPLDEVLALPDLARALVFAAMRVTGREASPGDIEARLKIVSELREPMLQIAEALALRKVLPAKKVEEIRKGTGKWDLASDGVALVALYADHADAVRGKHPFTQQEFEQLEEASEWLLDTLTPDGAARPVARTRGEPEDMRDRLWTLLSRRYVDLRKIAYYFYGDAFEAVVPKLQSRVAGAAKEDEQDEEDDAADDEDDAADDEHDGDADGEEGDDDGSADGATSP